MMRLVSNRIPKPMLDMDKASSASDLILVLLTPSYVAGRDEWKIISDKLLCVIFSTTFILNTTLTTMFISLALPYFLPRTSMRLSPQQTRLSAQVPPGAAISNPVTHSKGFVQIPWVGWPAWSPLQASPKNIHIWTDSVVTFFSKNLNCSTTISPHRTCANNSSQSTIFAFFQETLACSVGDGNTYTWSA